MRLPCPTGSLLAAPVIIGVMASHVACVPPSRAYRGAGMPSCNNKATTWQPWRSVECRADLALTLPDGRRQAAFAPLTRTTLRLCATRADACNAERESAHWPVTLLSGDAASLAPLFARGFRPALVAGRLQMVLQGARRLAGLHARPRHRGWQGGRGCRQAVPREQGPRQGGRGSRRRSCGPGRRVGRGRAAADRGGRLAHH